MQNQSRICGLDCVVKVIRRVNVKVLKLRRSKIPFTLVFDLYCSHCHFTFDWFVHRTNQLFFYGKIWRNLLKSIKWLFQSVKIIIPYQPYQHFYLQRLKGQTSNFSLRERHWLALSSMYCITLIIVVFFRYSTRTLRLKRVHSHWQTQNWRKIAL